MDQTHPHCRAKKTVYSVSNAVTAVFCPNPSPAYTRLFYENAFRRFV